MNTVSIYLPRSLKSSLIIISSCLLFCQSLVVAAANSFVVTTTLDMPDLFPGDGICSTSAIDRACSLRAAIIECNASGGGSIELAAGNYVLTLAGPIEDAAQTGDLDITSDITINGAGINATVISGNDLDRVFDIFSADLTRNINVKMRRLTITKGWLQWGQDGSGIMNWENLTLDHVKIDDNFNLGQGGGAAMWNHGSIYLNKVTISNNLSGGLGGGISNEGYAEISNSVFFNNEGVSGGGIYNNSSTGDLIISNTDFLENYGAFLSGGGGILLSGGNVVLSKVRFRANKTGTNGGAIAIFAGRDLKFIANDIILDRNLSGNFGGGLYIEDFIGSVDAQINYATISNNRAIQGGGIYQNNTRGSASPLRIQNVTISSNVVDFDGGGIYSTGSFDLLDSTVVKNRSLSYNPIYSGIGVHTTTTTAADVNFQRSLIAKNKASPLNPSPDCYINPLVTFNSLDYNLIGRAGTECSFNQMPDDIVGSFFLPIDPKIGPLESNGGFSKTHRLNPDSPAIDAGGNGLCGVANDDQRGVARPQDGDNSGTVECDIGAFEFMLP